MHPLRSVTIAISAKMLLCLIEQLNSDLIILIDKIHYHLHHHVLFFRPTLGNHQREGYEGIVRQSFAAIGAIEDAVVVEEPKE